MSDYIRRADAIEAVQRWKDYDGDICWREAIDKAKDALSALPSADAYTEQQVRDDYWNGRVPTHGRLIDADALYASIAKDTYLLTDRINSRDYGMFLVGIKQKIDEAPTVPVVDITQRDLCKDISCTDCPFMEETCKLMDYVAYADRPHGEWIEREDWNGDSYYDCSVCGESFVLCDGTPSMNLYHYCPNCGADMRKENK